MLNSILHNNNNDDIISFLHRKEKRDMDKMTNERLEKIINRLIVIYNFIIPLSAYLYSLIVPEYDWNLLGVSIWIFSSAIILYLTVNILDIFRPYKGCHLYVDEDYTNWGCLGVLGDFLIPFRGLISSSYDEHWYITLLIISIWICFFYLLGIIMNDYDSLRTKLFLTPKEIIIEHENRKKKEIGDELKKEGQKEKNNNLKCN